MISVDRFMAEKPESLNSGLALREKDRAEKFFLSGKDYGRFRFEERVYTDKSVHEELVHLFNGKCAFSDSLIENPDLHNITHYRPPSHSISSDGKLSREHYWWLAYEWDNIYLASGICSRAKGSRFEVESERAPVQTGLEFIHIEKPLLLDPCKDNPEEHFVYDSKGFVSSDSNRGRVSIETYNLNDISFVEQRRIAFQRLLDTWSDFLADDQNSEGLQSLLSAASPFLAMKRQFIKQWSERDSTSVKSILPDQSFDATSLSSEEKVQSTFENFKAYQFSKSKDTLKSQESTSSYFEQSRFIRQVDVKNYRGIRDLSISMPVGDSSSAGWLVLLGENGTGKSSLLTAIALCLADEDYRARLDITPNKALAHGTEKGFVKVYLSGENDPVELRFEKDETSFESNQSETKVLLLGYGATRLLPQGPHTGPDKLDYIRVDNLFDPFVPLDTAEEWLDSLGELEFAETAEALRSLLALGKNDMFIKDPADGKIKLVHNGVPCQLSHLSSGYQSMVALAVDIMSVMTHRWGDMAVAEGIVLIDEIGAHLHPRWQMRIIKSLKEVFPRVQFIATTHSPLSLRGLEDGEVALLKYDENGNNLVSDLPSINGLRVDQLLTSEIFGLNSTLDPDIEDQFQEYYYLLGLEQRSDEEQKRVDFLKEELKQYENLGDTRRQRLMLEHIDGFIARNPDLVSKKAKEDLSQSTKTTFDDIWNSVQL